MRLKGIACLLIALIGCAMGLEYRGRLTARVKSLIMFSLLFTEIRASIAHSGTALHEIMWELAICQPDNRFLAALREALDGQSFCGAWQAALSSTKGILCLTTDDVAMLNRCATLLGKNDVDGELRALDIIDDRLSQAIAEAREKQRTDGTVYVAVGSACGTVLALLLL